LTIDNGGQGYSSTNTVLSIVPTISTVVEGDRVQISYDPDYNQTNLTEIIGARFYIGADLSGSLQGSGYVVAPRYQVAYPHFGRLPLEDPTAGSTTSRPQFFDDNIGDNYEASVAPIVTGGFSHAPVFFEINATKENGVIEEVGLLLDSEIVNSDFSPPFNISWIPDDPGYYNLYSYAKDNLGNITMSEELTILVQEMEGSNIKAEFLSPQTDTFTSGSNIFLSVQATGENGISNVEFFMDGQSIGFGEKSSFSNNFTLNYEIVGFAEGDYEFSFIARDSKGNQSGVFSSEFTTIPERQSKIIRILPQGDFIPKILAPRNKNAFASASAPLSDGTLQSINVTTGGYGYRFPPKVVFEGGGGTGAVATAVLKDGVIKEILVDNPGSGYDPNRVYLKIFDNGQEHP
jgi:hypothetical protein